MLGVVMESLRFSIAQYTGNRLGQRVDDPIWLHRPLLHIAVIHKEGRASCGPSRLYVAPAVANTIALGEIDIPLGGSLEQHAWFWLPAVTIVGVDVAADLDIVH